MGNKNPQNVEIGDWYSMCCILDLYQIKTASDLDDIVSYLQDAIDDPNDDVGMNTWKTLKEAVDEIVNIWGDDINERLDLKLLLENSKGE